jgi:hypothetical protein
MTAEMDRRGFVKRSVVASAGAALAMNTAAQTGESTAAAAEGSPPQPQNQIPMGKIADMEISRLLLGGNLLTHYTHSRDLKYVYGLAKNYNTERKILETLELAEQHGINTLVIHNVRPIMALLKKHRQNGGKMQWITCTFHALVGGNLTKFNAEIEQLVDDGTDAVYISGVEADNLCGYPNDISAVNAAERIAEPKLDLLAQAVELARAYGLPTGLGAHRMGSIKQCETAGIDVDFYLKTLHHHNYPSAEIHYDSSFCPQPEELIEFMKSVEKPWIAFKVMAAGAIPPQNAFRYAFDNGADFVLAGMFDFEIAEDVRIVNEAFAKCTRVRPLQA